MGELAEMIGEGLLCQMCGGLMEDQQAPGYPRTCEDCQGEPVVKKQKNRKKNK